MNTPAPELSSKTHIGSLPIGAITMKHGSNRSCGVFGFGAFDGCIPKINHHFLSLEVLEHSEKQPPQNQVIVLLGDKLKLNTSNDTKQYLSVSQDSTLGTISSSIGSNPIGTISIAGQSLLSNPIACYRKQSEISMRVPILRFHHSSCRDISLMTCRRVISATIEKKVLKNCGVSPPMPHMQIKMNKKQNEGKAVITPNRGNTLMGCPRCLQSSVQNRIGPHICLHCGFEWNYMRPVRAVINGYGRPQMIK